MVQQCFSAGLQRVDMVQRGRQEETPGLLTSAEGASHHVPVTRVWWWPHGVLVGTGVGCVPQVMGVCCLESSELPASPSENWQTPGYCGLLHCCRLGGPC